MVNNIKMFYKFRNIDQLNLGEPLAPRKKEDFFSKFN